MSLVTCPQVNYAAVTKSNGPALYLIWRYKKLILSEATWREGGLVACQMEAKELAVTLMPSSIAEGENESKNRRAQRLTKIHFYSSANFNEESSHLTRKLSKW